MSSNDINVFIHRITEDAIIPSCGTPLSACFDLHCDFSRSNVVKVNGSREKHIINDSLTLRAGERALVPTGLIFLLPEAWQMKILPRSGNAWKKGYTVLNTPGTIDPDYTHETFVLVYNGSTDSVEIKHGDRVAQAELVPVTTPDVTFTIADEAAVLNRRNNLKRDGGIGSTGS